MKKKFIFIISICLAINKIVFAQQSSLDSTFSFDGIVTTDIGYSFDYGYAVVIQSDGKIVIAGYTDNGYSAVNNKDFSLVRYNINGMLDSTFGTGGKVITGIGINDECKALAIQSDGKIVAVGYSESGSANGDFAIVRYNINGTLDNTFGIGGKVITDFGTYEAGNSVAIQLDGKIIVAGVKRLAYSSLINSFASARYNSNGTLDNTYGISGKVTTVIAGLDDVCNSVAIQSDGKIVSSGYCKNSGSGLDFAVVRYNTNGTLDNTFGTSGIITTDFFSSISSDICNSVAIQPDGKIVVGGQSYLGVSTQFAIARYDSTGVLDTTFGTGGKVRTAIGTTDDRGYSVALQTDGKIVLAGYSQISFPNKKFAIVRYDSTGVLDNTFGTGGKVSTIIGATSLGYSLGIQTDGKIIVGGHTKLNPTAISDKNFALTRYDINGVLDNTFGATGKVITDYGGSSDECYSIAVQPDGKIIMVGRTTNNVVYENDYDDFGIVRFDSTGILDNTFGVGGKAITDCYNYGDVAYSVAIQTDGKIVAVGYSNNGADNNFELVRYNSNGSFDLRRTTNFGSNSSASSVAIQPDGKIVMAGIWNNDFALARYDSGGTLDNTFGTSGKVSTDIENYDGANSIAIQPDGKILVAGYSYSSSTGSDFDFTLIRYDSIGALDTTFGIGGIVITDFSNNYDIPNSMAIQSNGKIVLVGKSLNLINNDYAIARYNVDGSLDATFGISGKVLTDLGSNNEIAESVSIQSDGKIVVGGISSIGSNYHFALVRYDSVGSLDSTFGTGAGGIIITPIGSDNSYCFSTAIQTDGKILMGGTANNGVDIDFALARFNYNILNTTGINNREEAETKMIIYPNPFNSFTTIQFNTLITKAEINIYDMFSRKIRTMQNISEKEFKLNRDNLPSGIYFVQLIQENKIISIEKFVIAD